MRTDYADHMTFLAVLWDMDGTLVDTEPYWIDAETQLMEAHGLTWTHEQAMLMVGNDLLVSAQIMHDHGLDLAIEEIRDTLLEHVIAKVKEHVPFRPGAAQLLAELREAGIPAALVTMSYRSLADAVVEACPPGSFTLSVTGDEVPAGKPDPAPYLLAAEALGLAPYQCVALEDSLPGLTSAEAAGTQAIGIPHMVPLEAKPGRVLLDGLDGVTLKTLTDISSGHAARRG